MKPIIYILTAGLLFVASQVFGQAIVTSLTPATVTAPIGNTVDLQLKVTNFTNVNSIQFPISFNAAVLQFNSIDNAALPGFTSGNYNATTGKVTISWFADPQTYPDGFSVPDNSSIFTLHFTVLTNGTSPVNIANLPPGIEIIRNNAPVTLNYQNGGSTVTGGSGGGGPVQGFSIIANTIYIPQGTIGCMPVTVHDFTNIVSMQYAMHWDSLVLQYQNTQSYNLPGMGALTFGGTPSSGLQLVGWDDPNALGVTRANGTKIYDVCFKAIGPVGSSSLVKIDSIGFPPGNGSAEAFNAASQNVWTSNSGVKDTIFIVTAPPPPNAVTFTASQDTAATGSQVCVDVTVNNFNSIISMQYGVTYDATKLTFVSVTPGPGVPGLTATNFNPNTPGQITFSWFDPNVAGVTLPANTVLFTVCFTIAAPNGTLIPINFGSLPGLPVEVVKEPDGPVNPAFVNGHVFVGTIVGGPTASITPKPACGGPNGSATAIGSGGTPTSYSWTGPNGFTAGNVQTINNLADGNYSVTITFVGGITRTATATVQSGPAVTISGPQVSNIKCHGETNGSISLTTSGGTAPYVSYAWTGPNNYTASTEDITGLGAGIYSFVATDTKGCTVAQNFTITDPPAIALSLATSQNVTCFNTATGKATINTGGGTPPLSYAWYTVPGGVLQTGVKNPEDLPVGTYNVTITDGNQCTATLPNPVTIMGPGSALSVATPVQKTDLFCWGYSNGSIHLNINGGWGGYTVAWNLSPSTGANLDGIPGGDYIPTITDGGGCSLTLPAIQVLEPPAVTYGTPIVVHNICANDGDGSINIQVSGGNGGGYKVEWTGGLQGESISNLAGGTYVPTITDVDQCTAVLPGIVVNEPLPIDTGNVVIIHPTSGNDDGAISPNVGGGTGTLVFQWSGPNGFTASTQNISNLPAGLYTLSVTDASGCDFTAQFTLGGALVVSINATPSCGNDGCLNVDILSGTPPYIISWSGASTGFATATTNSTSICTFSSGIINVTVTDNNNNTFTVNGINIDQIEPALVSQTITHPVETTGNGSITLNPVVPPPPAPPANYTYNWTGPNGFTSTLNTITNRDSGLYIVTVTNLNSGCTAVYTYQLNRDWPDFIGSVASSNDPTCVNTANGSISVNIVGGNPGPPTYTYAWSGPNGYTASTKDISGLLAGTYSLTATDYEGTTVVVTETITAQSQLLVTNVNETSSYGNPPFQVSGYNQCDGVASVVFSGGVGATSILWSNNVTGAQNTTLCRGPYSVSVTDGLGCVSVWSDSLTYPATVSIDHTIINEVSCHDECDGVARVYIYGGVHPYSVKWSTSQTDQINGPGGYSQAVNLCGGDYKVTVIDKLGAEYVFDVPLVAPAPIVVTLASVPSSTFNSCDAEFIAEAPGAVGPITYNWSGSYGHSGESQRAEGLCAGEIVEFIVYDANGCAGIGRDTVPYPEDGCYQVRPVITPGNQDGNNDFVFITCIEVVTNSIEIFNRWGQLVYETKGYDNAGNVWKGLSKNGEPLAEGVYFYVLNYTDPVRGQQQQKGHINLLR